MIQQRSLGRTGRMVSVVGFGGMLVRDETPEAAARLVAQAVDRGINYFDVAPTYGNAEDRLGPALEPWRRDVFLACKTTRRDGAGAAAELRQSLGRLRTPHFDLYQLHAMTTPEDCDQALAPGGALEAVVAARAAGLVRHIGFSAHSEDAALRLLDAFAFDTVMFPVNYASWLQSGFGRRLAARTAALGTGLLALKALSCRRWEKDEPRAWGKCWYLPHTDPEKVALAMRFTLSQPVAAALSPGHAELFWLACDAAEKFVPMPPAEQAGLLEKLGGSAIFPG